MPAPKPSSGATLITINVRQASYTREVTNHCIGGLQGAQIEASAAGPRVWQRPGIGGHRGTTCQGCEATEASSEVCGRPGLIRRAVQPDTRLLDKNTGGIAWHHIRQTHAGSPRALPNAAKSICFQSVRSDGMVPTNLLKLVLGWELAWMYPNEQAPSRKQISPSRW